MQTEHYIVENITEFLNQPETVKILKEYVECIEEKAFSTIEEVFGSEWRGDKINIQLNNSKSGGSYKSNVIKFGIYNRNIQKIYPENLWGCLFHETHHAFLNLITRDKENGRIFNGGHKAEVFNYAFMATTYLHLKEKHEINQHVCEKFSSDLIRELDWHNRNIRTSDKYEYEKNIQDNTMDIFQEYLEMFSSEIENFAKFISFVKKSNSVFTDIHNFRQDLDKTRKCLSI